MTACDPKRPVTKEATETEIGDSMITKGVAAIGSFVIGCLFTYLMHGYWHDEPVANSSPPPQHQSAITESVRAERSPERPVATTGQETPGGADNVPAHSFDQASAGDVPATRDESTESTDVAASKITLREPYGSMVAPRPAPETLTLPELFEAFSVRVVMSLGLILWRLESKTSPLGERRITKLHLNTSAANHNTAQLQAWFMVAGRQT